MTFKTRYRFCSSLEETGCFGSMRVESYEGLKPEEAVKDLMTRRKKDEYEEY